MNKISIIILSAGKGTRMKSDLPKVMYKIAGREMLNMVIDEAKKLNPQKITLVVSEEMENFYEKIRLEHQNCNIEFVIQKERKGTGHAVSCAVENSKNFSESSDKTVILYGDTPLIEAQTLEIMLKKIDDFSLCILGFEDKNPNSYGRLIIDENNNLQKIVEFKDANQAQKNILLCNSGVIAVKSNILPDLLSSIKNDNASKEYYLTDIVNIANQKNLRCTFIKTNNYEVLGVNSKIELAQIEKIKQQQIRRKMMEDGITLYSPKTVFFSFDTIIGNGTIIHPNVVFGPKVSIEKNVEIKSFCHIEGAKIKSNSIIGPFARIRPDTIIENDVHIGNFVEIKKSTIAKNSKINHLSYVGDATIGTNCNIGAGTITCNYDGFNKHKTTIGDNVFIGSNSALIAPITINNNAMIGAGSIITKNVAEDDLALSRSEQKNITQGAKKIRNSKKSFQNQSSKNQNV